MWWCVTCAVLRFLLGLVLLGVVKEVAKLVAREVLVQACKFVSIPCVCDKRVSQVTHLKVHYSSHFITLDKVSCTVHPELVMVINIKSYIWLQ